MSPPRVHRLPLNERLDYTLIPAPLDLSLPSLTEKSPLPAIIVTPSSPVSTHDFSIAFLAPEPKPSFLTRLSSLKARTAIVISLILFILVCHVVTHRLAARRPYLDFREGAGSGSWYRVPESFWGPDIPEDKRSFVIEEG